MSTNSNIKHSTNSNWTSHFSWFNNKLTSWWPQKQTQNASSRQRYPNPRRQDNHRQSVSNSNSKQHSLPTTQISNILSKMRSKNIDCIEEKIKRTNKYFIKKDLAIQKNGDFICPICLQFLVKPVLTICGHHFCIKCLDETLLFKTDCPSCRHGLKGTKIIQCDSLSKIIQRQVAKYSSQEIEFYNETLLQSLNWLKEKTIVPLEISINSKLDVKDTEHIWCVGIVKEIFYEKKNSKALLIHYQGWNPVYDQVIEISSERLAQEGFYTKRIDIPHYKLSQHQQRMYSYVITGEEAVQNNGLFPFFPSQQMQSEDEQQIPPQQQSEQQSESQESSASNEPHTHGLLNQVFESQDKIQEIQNNINNLQIEIEQYRVNIQSLLSSFQEMNEDFQKREQLNLNIGDKKQEESGRVQQELESLNGKIENQGNGLSNQTILINNMKGTHGNWQLQQNPEKWNLLLQY